MPEKDIKTAQQSNSNLKLNICAKDSQYFMKKLGKKNPELKGGKTNYFSFILQIIHPCRKVNVDP